MLLILPSFLYYDRVGVAIQGPLVLYICFSNLIVLICKVGFCLLKNMEQVGYRKEDIKKWMDWFYLETTPEERLDQV